MRIHANTTREDFLKFLYYALRDANMPAQVLDCVEELRKIEDMEKALEEEEAEREQAETAAFDLYEELAFLVDAIGDALRKFNEVDDIQYALVDPLKAARQTLERHRDRK